MPRSIIDAFEKPAVKIQQLKIQLQPQNRNGSIDYVASKSVKFRKRFEQRRENVIESQSVDYRLKNKKTLADADYLDVFIHGVRAIVNLPGVQFNELEIKIDEGPSDSAEILVANLPREIKCRSLKLAVSRFKCVKRFRNILSLMSSKYLTHLSLSLDWITTRASVDLSWLMKVPALKNLQKLEIDFESEGIRFKDICHLKEVKIHSTDFTVEEVTLMNTMWFEKDACLDFTITCENLPVVELIEEFGEFTKPKVKTWVFENSEYESFFKLKMYHFDNWYGAHSGCIVSARKNNISRQL